MDRKLELLSQNNCNLQYAKQKVSWSINKTVRQLTSWTTSCMTSCMLLLTELCTPTSPPECVVRNRVEFNQNGLVEGQSWKNPKRYKSQLATIIHVPIHLCSAIVHPSFKTLTDGFILFRILASERSDQKYGKNTIQTLGYNPWVCYSYCLTAL